MARWHFMCFLCYTFVCGRVGSSAVASGCGGCKVTTCGSVTAIELGDHAVWQLRLICSWRAWLWHRSVLAERQAVWIGS
jgi:hypothetical protein